MATDAKHPIDDAAPPAGIFGAVFGLFRRERDRVRELRAAHLCIMCGEAPTDGTHDLCDACVHT